MHAELGDKKGYFIFDTGAEDLILNNKELIGESQFFETLSGSQSMTKTKVQVFSLGNYTISNVDAFAMDLSHLEDFTNVKLLGIVGTKIFDSELIHIDNVQNRIQLTQRSYLSELRNSKLIHSDVLLSNGIPLIPVQINDKKYLFGLDTGSSVSVMDVKHISQLSSQKSPKQISILTTETKGDAHQIQTIDKINLGILSIKDLEVITQSLDAINKELDSKIDGILSLNQIEVSNVYIDILRSKIFFQI